MNVYETISAIVGIISILLLTFRYMLQKRVADLSKSHSELLIKEKLFDTFNPDKFPVIAGIKKETYFELSYGISLPEKAISLIFSNEKSSLLLRHIDCGVKKLKFTKHQNCFILRYSRLDKWLEWAISTFGCVLIISALLLITQTPINNYNPKAHFILFFVFLTFIFLGVAMFVTAVRGIIAYKSAYSAISLFNEMKEIQYNMPSKNN